MLNCRSGDAPETEVKMPLTGVGFWSVRRSSWYGMNATGSVLSGRHDAPSAVLVPPSWMFPFELTWIAVVAVRLYSETGNGAVTAVVQSSQWLPTSVVPGTIDAPVERVTAYACESAGE